MSPLPTDPTQPPEPAPGALWEPFCSVLRDYGEVRVTLASRQWLGGHSARSDLDAGIVYLDPTRSDAEWRADLAHEIEHLRDPTETDEDIIEARAAARLVPLQEALAAMTHAEIAALAARLRVDCKMVRARQRCIDTEQGRQAS